MLCVIFCNYRFIFLQRAIELFKTAQQRSGDLTLHQSYINQAQRALADAQKDNDFIYHERIPDAKHLDAIGKAPLAKITPIPERLSSNFKGGSVQCFKIVHLTSNYVEYRQICSKD